MPRSHARGSPGGTLGFVILTVLIAGLPFIVLLAMGRRAESTLPKIRDWMNSNSWIVNEARAHFFPRDGAFLGGSSNKWEVKRAGLAVL